MSEETIKIGTVLSVDDAKRSINDLRTSIDRSRTALKGLNEGTKEYNDTLNKLLDDQAKLAKIINELPTTTKTVTERFDAMQKSVQGMTSGFQALQGIMQLTNTENQNVINGLHKMMAVQQVVQGINGFISAIRGSTIAMRIFNMVVKANPLMLLISAVAATVAAFATLKLSIGETERDLRSLEDRVVDIKIKYSDSGYSSDIDKQLTDKAKRLESEKALKKAKDELQDFLKAYNKSLDDVDKIGTVISQNQTKLFKGLGISAKKELASRLLDIYQLQNEYYAEDLKAKQQQMEEEIDLNTKRMESEGATEESIFKMKQEYRNKFMAEREAEVKELQAIQKMANRSTSEILMDTEKWFQSSALLDAFSNVYSDEQLAEFAMRQKKLKDSYDYFFNSFGPLGDILRQPFEYLEGGIKENAEFLDEAAGDLILKNEIMNRAQTDALNISAENQAIYNEVQKKNEKEAAEYTIKVAKDLFDAKIKQQEEYHKEALKSSEEYRKENEKLLADYARTEADLENQAAIDKRAKEEEALETNLQRIEYYNNKKLELTEELKQKEAEANLLGPVSEDDSNLIVGEKIRINKELLEIRRQLAGEEASLFQEEKIRDEERKNMLMERVELQNNLNEQLAYIKEGQEEQRAKEDEQKLSEMEEHRNSLDILLNETLAKLEMKDLEIEKEQELLEVYADLTNQRINIDNKYAQTKQKLEQKKQAIEQSGLRSTSTILKSAGSLLSEHTAGYKALAIASTTIDTYAAAQSAYKYMTPIGGPIAGGLAAAAAVASGIQNIMAIKSTEVKGASSSNDGGSVNVPLTIEPIDVQENFTKLDSDDLDIINNTNQRVYVVESDITETQNRVKVNESEATF